MTSCIESLLVILSSAHIVKTLLPNLQTFQPTKPQTWHEIMPH